MRVIVIQFQIKMKKNMCLAQAKNDKSYCYSIYGNNDQKNMCLGKVTGDSSYCYSIYNDSNAKNSCLAQTK